MQAYAANISKEVHECKVSRTPSSSNLAKIRGGPERQVAYLSWHWSRKARLILQPNKAILTNLHEIIYITEPNNNTTRLS